MARMGITDNLFQRKSLSKRAQRNTGGSQQFRLNNPTQRRFGPNSGGPKDDAALKKGEYVTRFVVDDQDGNGSTLVGSSVSCSLPDLSNSSIYERSSTYPKCVCYRSACYIACDEFNCHFTGIGRVRTRCPCHPTVTFLLDLPQCPRCLGSMREYPDRIIPPGLDDEDDEDL